MTSRQGRNERTWTCFPPNYKMGPIQKNQVKLMITKISSQIRLKRWLNLITFPSSSQDFFTPLKILLFLSRQISHNIAKKQVSYRILPFSQKWEFKRTSSNIEQQPLFWTIATSKDLRKWFQMAHTKWQSQLLTNNTLLQPQHKRRKILNAVLSVHPPIQNFLGKELHFLKNFNLLKKRKHRGSLGERRVSKDMKKRSTRKTLRRI